jgi:hypothetical protein
VGREGLPLVAAPVERGAVFERQRGERRGESADELSETGGRRSQREKAEAEEEHAHWIWETVEGRHSDCVWRLRGKVK